MHFKYICILVHLSNGDIYFNFRFLPLSLFVLPWLNPSVSIVVFLHWMSLPPILTEKILNLLHMLWWSKYPEILLRNLRFTYVELKITGSPWLNQSLSNQSYDEPRKWDLQSSFKVMMSGLSYSHNSKAASIHIINSLHQSYASSDIR